MAERSLTDLKEIIQYAKRTGIVEFELDGLKFKFGENQPPPRRRRLAKEDPENAKQNNLQNNMAITEERLEQLRLEDPLAYEEAMFTGELTKDNND